jgi:hypothetical protein
VTAIQLERHRIACRKWYRLNSKRIRLKASAYRKTNREQGNAATRSRQKRYRATRPTFKLLEALKHRLKRTLKCAVNSKTRATRDLLGCSMDDFKIYLESKFEPGMSWGNYGYRGWHVDHIVPCALFDLSKPAHVRRCFHFSNLQPLWAQDNLRKGVQSSNQFNLL